jgi:hypothetical protein
MHAWESTCCPSISIMGPIGSLQLFLGSLGADAGEPESHQMGQNQRWHFVWWPRSHPEGQKTHVDWILAIFVDVRAEHIAWCLFAVWRTLALRCAHHFQILVSLPSNGSITTNSDRIIRHKWQHNKASTYWSHTIAYLTTLYKHTAH